MVHGHKSELKLPKSIKKKMLKRMAMTDLFKKINLTGNEIICIIPNFWRLLHNKVVYTKK
jgi:hypothetical protein